MTKQQEALLSLIRLGIGHQSISSKSVDWKAVEELAYEQGLSAVLIDGMEKLPVDIRPPKEKLLKLIGEILQGYEYRYENYKRTIADLAKFYNAHGFKMMILKGYACGMNWPKPEHRPCGDIDIWQFGEYKKADSIVAAEKGIKIEKMHPHHTVFHWDSFTVENHYDFINIHRHGTHYSLERIFKELGQDDSNWTILHGEKVYLPSVNLHALFLLRHSLNHFASIGITLRQVLDWAFFVQKHTKEIDWPWLLGILKQYNMVEFFNCMNAICVEELGFMSNIFPIVQFNPVLKERVLLDILEPHFVVEPKKRLFPRLISKYKRWKVNKWKRELCYYESDWDIFWRGVWSHITKPLTI